MTCGHTKTSLVFQSHMAKRCNIEEVILFFEIILPSFLETTHIIYIFARFFDKYR